MSDVQLRKKVVQACQEASVVDNLGVEHREVNEWHVVVVFIESVLTFLEGV